MSKYSDSDYDNVFTYIRSLVYTAPTQATKMQCISFEHHARQVSERSMGFSFWVSCYLDQASYI